MRRGQHEGKAGCRDRYRDAHLADDSKMPAKAAARTRTVMATYQQAPKLEKVLFGQFAKLIGYRPCKPQCD
jgi:hypothetical protein